jgi:hypothetical protein
VHLAFKLLNAGTGEINRRQLCLLPYHHFKQRFKKACLSRLALTVY